MKRVLRILIVGMLSVASPAFAADDGDKTDDLVVSHGSVTIAGHPRTYTARAGLLPILDDATGTLMARMFVVAYTLDQPKTVKPRPLTFVWNGGPGANVAESHLLGFGPMGYVTPPTYPDWHGTPERIAARPETLLASSDLVFVDPIGTGYSRATSETYRAQLYTAHGDAEAVAEAIRVYRTRYDAFDQPLFISGESYGATRAMLVAEALVRRRAPLAGVILISGAYDVGQVVPPALSAALQLPMFTATAYWHKRLPPDLQALSRDAAVHAAEVWARTAYAPLLERRDNLSAAERAHLLTEIARFSGVDPRFIDPKTLTLTKDVDLDRLLDGEQRELGRYDSRLAQARRSLDSPWWPTADPSITPLLDELQGSSPSVLRYIRDTLGFKSDLLYKGPFGEGFHPAPLTYVAPGGASDDWMTLLWDRAKPPPAPTGAPQPSSEPALRRAMLLAPRLRVMNVTGLYDYSCAEKDEAVARSEPMIRARVRNLCYPSGHAFYTDAAVRIAYQHDFAAFVRDAGQP